MTPITSIISLFVLGILAAFFWLWPLVIARLVGGKPLLPHEPRRPVPWGLVDLGIALLVLFGASLAVVEILRSCGIELGKEGVVKDPEALAAILLANLAATISAFLLTLLVVKLRTRAEWSDLGFTFRQIGRDCTIALAAFAMLAPLVYLIQYLLTLWFPYEHPLIKSAVENPDWRFFTITGLTAVIAAPLAEEFQFRVLLQGWLERVTTHRGDAAVLLLGGAANDSETADGIGADKPIDASIDHNEQETRHDKELPTIDPADDGNPYAPPSSDSVSYGQDGENLSKSKIPLPFWPILVSAALFAGMHANHGPAPVPLFVLALGLGYVYQRTHRILPCILVHLLLNATSMAMLWVGLLLQSPDQIDKPPTGDPPPNRQQQQASDDPT